MKPWILCVEDEPEVRDVLVRDLEPFASAFDIEEAADAGEAAQRVAQFPADDHPLALVLCDHVLPGKTGVDFLVELNRQEPTAAARKVLVTGQAGLQDTITAINEADLDHFLEKPWKVETLHRVVRSLLTDYVIDECDELEPFVASLDAPRLLAAIGEREADR